MNDFREENKKIVEYALRQLLRKIDYEKFLDMFNDRYNWFGFLGLNEKDYEQLSLSVRELRDVLEREKSLISTDSSVEVNTVVLLEKQTSYGNFYEFKQIIGTKPRLFVVPCYDRLDAVYNFLCRELLHKKPSDVFEFNHTTYEIKNIWTLDDFYNKLIFKNSDLISVEDGDIVVGHYYDSNYYDFFQIVDSDIKDRINGIENIMSYNLEHEKGEIYINDLLAKYKLINVMKPDEFYRRFEIDKPQSKVLKK